jgi:hypothetical protein
MCFLSVVAQWLMELRLTLRASKFADAKSGPVSFGHDSAALRGSELAQSVTVSSNCNYNFFAAVINSRCQTRAYYSHHTHLNLKYLNC